MHERGKVAVTDATGRVGRHVVDLLDSGLYEQDAQLPGPHATLAGPTFEEWLGSESAD